MPTRRRAADSRAGDGSGIRSPRRTAAVFAMAAGALLGAWLVFHHGLAVPLLIAALLTAVPAVTASGREWPRAQLIRRSRGRWRRPG
ncbi:hypothetical protein [Streptomyces sp. SD15]